VTAKRRTAGRRKPIRVGVVGVGRGSGFASGATDRVGMKLVALCDTWEENLREAGRRFGVKTYADYGRFLEHEMDAVVLPTTSANTPPSRSGRSRRACT